MTSIDTALRVVGRFSPSLRAGSRLLRNRSPALGGSNWSRTTWITLGAVGQLFYSRGDAGWQVRSDNRAVTTREVGRTDGKQAAPEMVLPVDVRS